MAQSVKCFAILWKQKFYSPLRQPTQAGSPLRKCRHLVKNVLFWTKINVSTVAAVAMRNYGGTSAVPETVVCNCQSVFYCRLAME